MVDIQTNKEDEKFLIEVKGEVDASSSIQLDDAFKSALSAEKKIMVDLSGLEYISSAGLGVFVSHLEEIRSQNVRLVLFGLSESVQQIFNLLGLPELLEIVESKEEASKYLD
ncbi:MAG: STAS domain-containing protein [Flavobacteriales bacterium]|nr:STAS domain-containing protein [Flavobacteriales bacterium]